MLLNDSENSQTCEDTASHFHVLISMKEPNGEAFPLAALTVLLKSLTESMFHQIGWEKGVTAVSFYAIDPARRLIGGI